VDGREKRRIAQLEKELEEKAPYAQDLQSKMDETVTPLGMERRQW
jgi:hypothetical protein